MNRSRMACESFKSGSLHGGLPKHGRGVNYGIFHPRNGHLATITLIPYSKFLQDTDLRRAHSPDLLKQASKVLECRDRVNTTTKSNSQGFGLIRWRAPEYIIGLRTALRSSDTSITHSMQVVNSNGDPVLSCATLHMDHIRRHYR